MSLLSGDKKHFAKECTKRIRGEGQAAKYILLTIPEEQEEKFSNNELDLDNNSSAALNY